MSAITVHETGSVITELPRPKGPGARLKAARQAKQLDLDLVAAQLHLSHDMIVALEADDYENLPARVFVIGYLRNYARHVGLPPEAIVQALNNYFPPEETRGELPKVGNDASEIFEPVSKAKRSSFSFVSLLLLVLAIALFFAWQEGMISVPEQFKQVGLTESGTVTPSEDSSMSLNPLSVSVISGSEETSVALPMPMPMPDPELSVRPKQADDLLKATQIEQIAATEMTAQPIESSDPAIAENLVRPSGIDETQVQEAAIEPLALVPPVKELPAAETASVIAAKPEIIVSFSDVCWVDIRDSAKTFKYMDQAKAGTIKKLTGKPPYKVLLGNATAAKITINGEPFDLQRYTKGNVARFSLDPSAL